MMDREALIARLLDHYQKPRHRGALVGADVTLTGGDPGCGDTIVAYLKVAPGGEALAEVSFEGQGCTISQAAASILGERVIGMTLAEITAMDEAEMLDLLGREVVSSRPRCATLALRTLKAAITKYRMDAARGVRG